MKVAILGTWHVHVVEYTQKALQFGEVIGFYEKDEKMAENFKSKFDLPRFNTLDELLESDAEGVIVCSASCDHTEDMIRVAKAKTNIFTEKVLALTDEDCEKIEKAVNENGVSFTISLFQKYKASRIAVKEIAESGELGKIRRITMGALSYMPGWGGWFSDAKKSGGCIFDFHIHDVDILRFLLGEPQAVSSVSYREGDASKYVNTRFMYDGIIAEAEASFDESNTAPYARWYRVRFDKASVVYKGKEIMVYPDDGEPYEAETVECDRTVGEISYFANVILNREENTVNSGEIASGSIRLCELIAKSAELQGDKIYL
jgi:predicted dehydrogenase